MIRRDKVRKNIIITVILASFNNIACQIENYSMLEQERIAEIVEGNNHAFRQLVDEYHEMVFSTCYGFVHNKADADDLAQEVFIELFHSLKRFRGQSKLSTWIYRIAVNKSINYLRDNKRNRLLRSLENIFTISGDTIEGDEAADKKITCDEQREMLHDAMNSLPKNQRIAFSLNKYDDLSYKQIAEVMNISLSSVESLIHRAKKKLLKRLER